MPPFRPSAARAIRPVTAAAGLTSPATVTSALTVLVVSLAASAPADAQDITIPPDTVTTVYVSDTIPGYGAVGGVATDALGYVYVADFRNSIWRLTTDGHLTRFADGIYGASGIAVGPRGEIYQSSFNGNYVSRISRSGEAEVWASEGLAGPVGIAVGAGGELYVCNCMGGSIARIGEDRVAEPFAASPDMACPNGITMDDRGDLYVVSFNNTRVLRITPEGEVSVFTDIPGAGGNGHITFAGGAFYVTKFRGNRIYRLERDGSFRVVAGTGEAGERDGSTEAATFTRPNGIAAGPNGRVFWVNDLVEGQGAGLTGPTTASLRRIRFVGLSDVLADAAEDGGVEAIRAAYRAYHEARPDESTSADAVARAYRLFSAGRGAEGLAVLELNAERYPGSAEARYRLGEGYRLTGRPGRAAEEYRRVLELDPDHPQARERLETVGGG